QLAQQFGLSPEQAESAVAKLAPALTGALGKNAAAPGGLESLKGALASGNHGRYLDNPAALSDPTTTEDGNAILGHLLGSKDVSRRVAGEAGQSTGLDVGILKQMLPVVATLVMGAVSKKAAPGGAAAGSSGTSGVGGLGDLGGLGSILEGLTGGGATGGMGGSPARSGGLGGLLGKIFG